MRQEPQNTRFQGKASELEAIQERNDNKHPDLTPEELETASKEIAQELTTWLQDNDTNLTPETLDTFLKEFGTLLDSLNTEDLSDFLFPQPPLLDTVIDFFTTDDWSYTKLQGEPILQLGFQGENGQWHCTAQVNEDTQQFAFYSHYPTNTPNHHYTAIAELLTRANHGLALGNFELDYSDGEIRYKTSIDVQGDALSTDLVQNLVYTNVMIMDKYFPGILAVLEQRATPQQAINAIENNQMLPTTRPPTPATLNPMDRLVW